MRILPSRAKSNGTLGFLFGLAGRLNEIGTAGAANDGSIAATRRLQRGVVAFPEG
jgi:hypothetical protein